jgi:hypothetical protein
MKGVVVGEGDSYEKAPADVESAIRLPSATRFSLMVRQ